MASSGWAPGINKAVWLAIFPLLPLGFNMFNVRRYGEIEYWLTVTKIAAVVGFMVFALLLPMGVSTYPRHPGTDLHNKTVTPVCDNSTLCVPDPGFDCTTSLSHSANEYLDWRNYGFDDDYLTTNGAISRLAGFWFCCCQAVYAYGGSTIIGITANEAERQRETLPKAVRRVSERLIFYYSAATFALGLSLWSKDPLLASAVNGSYNSPYVIMVERSGIPGLPHLANAIVLLATISTANANLYETVYRYH